MKLSSLFVGKLVRGIEGKVDPIYEQENYLEPIGLVVDFTIDKDNNISPVVLWIGHNRTSGSVNPENLQELE